MTNHTSDLIALAVSQYPPSERTLWDIVWGCSLTIFACTWVSVHPNMPGPEDGRLVIWLRRLELMVWAVLAPEMIIFWSLRQWFGARRLAKKYEGGPVDYADNAN